MPDTKADSSLPSDSLVPIRTIASLTGVNPVTLRAWERRYQLLQPVRTPKGHRLYSMADVETIKRVVVLLERGISISQVNKILHNSIKEPSSAPKQRAPQTGTDLDSVWSRYRQRLIQAIVEFDEAAASEVYNEILSLYPVDIVTERLIVPLLQEIGWRWQRGGEGRVAEEHFFSVFLRNKLGARFHHRSRQTDGPKLVTACMPNEQHETGLLLFGLAAQDWGYNVVLLGANTPLDELPAVVQRIDARAIVLSGSAEPEPTVIEQQLPSLVAAANVPVFIGGRVIDRFGAALRDTGSMILDSDFSTAMRALNEALLPAPPQ